MNTLPAIVSRYGSLCQDYIDALGHIERTGQADRELIGTWASSLSGPVLDLGCGPGHWTKYISAYQLEVTGIDPTPGFIEHARRAYPAQHFLLGTVADLAPASYSGILSWYSLIHLEPEQLAGQLGRIRSTLTGKGSLLLGYFRGRKLEVFEHAIAPAWFWPDSFILGALEEAGFTPTYRESRKEPGVREHGAIIASTA